MSDTDKPRLIEVAFPLKQASLDSVHEKNVRHGHISTLHIWPARRPLAACRAALIATLLPDPGDPKKREELIEKLAGKVVSVPKKKKLPSGKVEENLVEETVGGILHWGRESSATLDWFREEIKKAYGGRAPKVLDPFAGGGAIPLEAMRLGCEATAIDINPVAWFILKCTLEYPQKLAGQHRPLPKFALESPEFMETYFKSTGKLTKTQLQRNVKAAQMEMFPAPDVDLAWHVRAWGWWVLQQARKELASFYPTYADWEPLQKTSILRDPRQPKLVPLKEGGALDIHTLNADLGEDYLQNPANPRWIAKPTVAYLWARAVKCKNCRAILPLLKTRWLCKKENKRILLTMSPREDKTGVDFGIQKDVPVIGGNAAQRRENDKRAGAGTMSRSGAKCPCCGVIMTMEDIRVEGCSGRLDNVMTAVVVEGSNGKEYRSPIALELTTVEEAYAQLPSLYERIPFGFPTEPLPSKEALGFRVPLYGYDKWSKLFTQRQLLALGVLVEKIRSVKPILESEGYPKSWTESICALLACVFSRTADYMANACIWESGAEEVKHMFMRWALPITWDFAEANPLAPIERFYLGGLNSAYRVLTSLYDSRLERTPSPVVLNRSAIVGTDDDVDIVFTDPPYYDAIPYSDLMDFFYIWLRRTVADLSSELSVAFREPLSPKWDVNINDGELIDDSSRHGGSALQSRNVYEDGMYRAFDAANKRLKPDGRLVVVFANKNPTAWEALVSAIIRAGFCVTGSWPIATEMPGGLRNLNRASLASSVWLICTKRPEISKAGWDNQVLEEMRSSITLRLRDFWDAGIRGPNFVWAATGPALEAYSKHPVVKKANEPGQLMSVSEFLRHVRRMVVDFVVGRVLTHGEGVETVSGMDDVTTYYLLHRNDFGMNEAPVGACIMYAISCGLSDRMLSDQYDILASGKSSGRLGEGEEEEDGETGGEGDGEIGGESSGSAVKLQPWNRRKKKSLGYEAPGGRSVPLIDQIHRLMLLWKAGDVVKVDEYLDERGLRNDKLFHQLLQALIELSESGKDERSLLESISNHVAARGVKHEDRQMFLDRPNTQEESQ